MISGIRVKVERWEEKAVFRTVYGGQGNRKARESPSPELRGHICGTITDSPRSSEGHALAKGLLDRGN